MTLIRPERPEDFEQVFEVNAAAFASEDEAKLVDKLRQVDGCISLVAESDGRIIGHISFSPLTLNDRSTFFTGLAPMSVLPEHQTHGIGSKLVESGLSACRDAGHTAVFVVGHAAYYPRFGFRPAADMGFTCEYPVPPDNFLALELVNDSLAGQSGLIKYDPVFAGF